MSSSSTLGTFGIIDTLGLSFLFSFLFSAILHNVSVVANAETYFNILKSLDGWRGSLVSCINAWRGLGGFIVVVFFEFFVI